MGRLQATCGARRSAVPCKQLRVFTSSYERLRAGSSAPGRVSSRLVAFGRVWSRQFFFFVFGHVRARLGVFFRHFSSFFVPKWFFREWRATGCCGTGWAGRAAVCCAWLPRAGGRMGKRAWYSFEIGIQLRHGRGCGRSSCAQVYYKSGAFAVAGNPRVHRRMGVGFRVALKGRTRSSCLNCGSGSQYAGDS